MAFPHADISVSVVWIEMLPTDSLEAAKQAASRMNDPRVRHFFDPRSRQLAGTALARGIIREGLGSAWDVYLFYDKQAEWTEEPPLPVEYYHQLSGGQRADPERFAGGALGVRLEDALHRLVQTAGARD